MLSVEKSRQYFVTTLITLPQTKIAVTENWQNNLDLWPFIQQLHNLIKAVFTSKQLLFSEIKQAFQDLSFSEL